MSRSSGSGNLLDAIPAAIPREICETLLERGAFKLERIISSGQATPPGQWYNQERDEWVVLLRGSAGLSFEGEIEPVVLQPGDYLLIPAHRRHRVEWTDAKQSTIWLALHFEAR